MGRVRAFLAVAIAIALLLGACGDDGDSNPGASSGTSGATGKSATAPGDRGGRKRKGRERGSKRDRKRRRQQTGGSEASGNVFYFKGRTRCVAIPLDVLARIYQAKSDDPKDVASAYAEREAPAPIYERAARSGCLAGIASARGR
jgi:hypothetical protein